MKKSKKTDIKPNPWFLKESQARPTDEQIATRARAIYEARGSLPGHDLENWLQARRSCCTNATVRLIDSFRHDYLSQPVKSSTKGANP